MAKAVLPAGIRIDSVEATRALRVGAWKYLRAKNGQESLFHLAADPSESTDRSPDEPARLRALRAQFETWHRWQEILELASIAVFSRPGCAAADAKAKFVPMRPLDISASDIRARLARGEDVSAMVPARVLDYIRQHRLYR